MSLKNVHDPIQTLRYFINTITDVNNSQSKIAKRSFAKLAIDLLEEVPSARDAVFDYFAIIAEFSIQNYISNAELDPQTSLPVQPQQQSNNKQSKQKSQICKEDECFFVIQNALQNLVIKGLPVWVPIIAAWCLEVSGRMSEKYTQRKTSIGIACNYWLNCDTMRGLLTLINMCFRKMNNTEAERCVEQMLMTFNRYPLSTDWIVARLGGCFPLQILTQILQCGIKRFLEDYSCQLDAEIGIIEYLAMAHEQEVKIALRELLQTGCYPKKPQDVVIIPFLLVTTSCSHAILQNFVNVFLEIYNEDILNSIVLNYPIWMNNKPFFDMQPTLNDLVLNLKEHGVEILIDIAKMYNLYHHNWCDDFLESSLQNLEAFMYAGKTCPIMDDLCTGKTKHLLWQSCLSTNLTEQQTATRLLLVVSSKNLTTYHQTISELLRKSYVAGADHEGFGALMRIIGGQPGIMVDFDITRGLNMVLEDILLQESMKQTCLRLEQTGTSEAYNTFNNLKILMCLAENNHLANTSHAHLPSALNKCLPKILQILDTTTRDLLLRINLDAKERRCAQYAKAKENNNNEVIEEPSILSNWSEADKDTHRLKLAHIIIELLLKIKVASDHVQFSGAQMIQLGTLSAKYFFIALTEPNIRTRLQSLKNVTQLMEMQCSTRKLSRTTCLRQLIEGAFFYQGFLFGEKEEPEIDPFEIPEHEKIMKQNQTHYSGAYTNRVVLHSGLIGRGLRSQCESNFHHKEYHENHEYFIKALNACCKEAEKPQSIDAYSTISLILIELVSPDVMYNGLPFPDEEFSKVTMERDLLIRRAFIKIPLLWTILAFLARNQPSLCYSSVLLRALCATCLHQWRAKNVNRFEAINPNDELVCCTKKVLELLSHSNFLPPPLSELHMIIHCFEAPEIVMLLRECVWNYLKDHVPSPALFQVDMNGLHWRDHNLTVLPAQYVDPLRSLMLKKIDKLGAYYYQLFVMNDLDTIKFGRVIQPEPPAEENLVTETEVMQID